MATIYQVSERAGVSLATVSRVMNGNAKVSETTRNKVLAAMAELNYRPNSIAQSLASNCSNSVGMLVSEVHGPFFGEMMSGVENELRTAGKHVIIAAGHSDEASEKEAIEFLISRKCDALILHVDAVTDQYLIDLNERTPVVIINRTIPGLEDHCICLNNELGGYQATKALLDMNHRQIAYISGPLWKHDARERFEGHKRALSEFGLPLDEALCVQGDFHEEGGARAMETLLASAKPFTAVACANDEMACGAMNCARDHKLDIPADVSVMGFDNVIMSRYTFPHLTTIDYPAGEMGRMAACWVRRQIYQDKQVKVRQLFEPSLVLRDSVRQL
ncbi:LacI family DNA-binding transcriptional regulator [Bowmanella dokdonensis]|uniref:LacI family DNA-binding transcriptional regulator n=1 Tax=Bowmanella dokdonensis TaxID=751969 RepID=A0A939DM00_9ALTE|nr:LacI family DNA-binding transcriptional regulator [Bowmanella dokdonensis]MBN7825214.1 LacI family DNA-binding transcriptional regulator [Bowmanella dokdonensis]